MLGSLPGTPLSTSSHDKSSWPFSGGKCGINFSQVTGPFLPFPCSVCKAKQSFDTEEEIYRHHRSSSLKTIILAALVGSFWVSTAPVFHNALLYGLQSLGVNKKSLRQFQKQFIAYGWTPVVEIPSRGKWATLCSGMGWTDSVTLLMNLY